jgi:hypothetical protein
VWKWFILMGLLVDLIGIEPMTSSMPWKRAPSCATGPLSGRTHSILEQPRPSVNVIGNLSHLPVSKGNRVSEHSAAGGALSSNLPGSRQPRYCNLFR